MSASSIAEIMQDKAALAAACEELAEFLDERAAFISAAAESGGAGVELARLLPLMVVFPWHEDITKAVTRLRAIVRRLDALPATAGELARVMAAPADEYACFEALLFEGDEHQSQRCDSSASAKQGVLFADEAPQKGRGIPRPSSCNGKGGEA